MAQEVSIGDVVELNSGGPKMTVASIQHDWHRNRTIRNEHL